MHQIDFDTKTRSKNLWPKAHKSWTCEQMFPLSTELGRPFSSKFRSVKPGHVFETDVPDVMESHYVHLLHLLRIFSFQFYKQSVRGPLRQIYRYAAGGTQQFLPLTFCLPTPREHVTFTCILTKRFTYKLSIF